jgi:hypothetical protein
MKAQCGNQGNQTQIEQWLAYLATLTKTCWARGAPPCMYPIGLISAWVRVTTMIDPSSTQDADSITALLAANGSH